MPNTTVTKAESTKRTKSRRLSEKGQVGIHTYGNFIQDLKRTELQIPRRFCSFDQMCQDAAVANSVDIRTLLAVVGLHEGSVKPKPNSEKSKIAADFLNYCLRNISSGSWFQAMRDANTDIKYGFSILNIVLEKRKHGKYKGSYTIKKLAPRNVKSVYGWVWDNNFNNLLGFVQKPQFLQNRATNLESYNNKIPLSSISSGVLTQEYPFFNMDEFLLFSYNATDNNPQGNPPLAACFESFIEKKIIEQLELAGASKDMGGIAVARSPSELFEQANDPENYPEAAREKIAFEQDLSDLHTSKTSFIHLQSDRDERGNYLYDFELKGITGSGSKQYNTSDIIREKTKAIYNCFGTQALLLGQDGVGSNALSKDQSTIFRYYVERDMAEKADVINNQLLVRILEANDIYLDYDDMPVFVPLNPFKLSYDESGKFIQRVKSVNAMTKEMLVAVIEDLGLPVEGIDKIDFTDKGASRAGESQGTSGTGDTQAGGKASESNMENGSSIDKSLVIDGDKIISDGVVINQQDLDKNGVYK